MWKWIKIPKIGALVAFFLPWLTISCSGTQLVSATGWQLAWGTYSASTLQTAVSPSSVGHYSSLWLLLAVVVIVIGIFITFSKQSKRESLRVVMTSGAALILIWVGTAQYSKSALVAAASRSANTGWSGSIDQATTAMIQVSWEIGYYLATIALMGAGMMAWLVYREKDAIVQDSIRSVARVAVASASELSASLTIEPEVSERDDKISNWSRSCPECGERYSAQQNFCSKDGSALSDSGSA